MRIIAILQARMGSTRLPGKSMLRLGDYPMVGHVLGRTMRASTLTDICLTVPWNDRDVFAPLAKAIGVQVVTKGKEDDLVGRYLVAAEEMDADIVVRVCCDNPCIDPVYIDQAIYSYLHGCYPFYTNTTAMSQDFVAVDGIGCEVFSFSRLQWLDRITRNQPVYREHPHKWFFDHHIVSLPKADIRLDVNTREDYEFLADIFDHVPKLFTTEDVLNYLATKEVQR